MPYVCTPRCIPHTRQREVYADTESRVPNLSCTINFTAGQHQSGDIYSPGQCWRRLFCNPIIAGGFPIPNRANESVGLEIPLDMLAALTRALYFDTFKSKVFIKGYNTMLIPTNLSGECLVWHLLQSKHPLDRISYLDADSIDFSSVRISDITQYRHILGWCSDSVSIAGKLIWTA
jgi:hypothetical protein